MPKFHDDGFTWDALERAVDKYRASIEDLPAIRPFNASEIRSHLAAAYPFDRPLPGDEVISDVAVILERWSVHTPNPAYFGLFNPDTLPITIAADALVAAFNPQLATWSHAPGANEMERHVLRTIERLAGLDSSLCASTFTAGGSEANHSAVIVALTRADPEFTSRGARVFAGQPVLYISREAHHSFVKIAHACGLGREAVREIDVDENLRMKPAALRLQIEQDRLDGLCPFMVVATAGTTSAGAIDPIPEISEVCRGENLWLHVDAAWGGGALLSRRLRPLLDGIDQADSITFDAHKWLSVPMGAGMFLCRHRQAVHNAFSIQTAYMPMNEGTPDPYHSTLQWSRRFNGLKAFMALANLGLPGYEGLIDHQSEMGNLLKSSLVEAGWIIVNRTELPIACFTHTRIQSGDVSIDAVLARIYDDGRHWISITEPTGVGRVLRACITNYRTEPKHIKSLIAALQSATG